jgi:glycosyltransferase involved in cell wall biosynthesis
MLKVCIIVPAHNEERYINTALLSLLNQNYDNLEIVVVDDKSTDRTREIVNSLNDKRIILIDGPGKGIASSLNAGIWAANGSIIMRCDADDFFSIGRVQKQVAWLAHHPEFDAVCGAFAAIDKKGNFISNFNMSNKASEITAELRSGITRTHLGTFAMRAETMKRIKGFREFFVSSSDIDFQLRFGEVSRVWYCPEIEYFYRIHNSSITHRQSNIEREFFESKARLFLKQRISRGFDDLQAGFTFIPPEDIRGEANSAKKHIQRLLIGEAWRKHAEGKKGEAIKLCIRSMIFKPLDKQAWRMLAVLIIKSF